VPAKDIYHDTVKRALEKDGWKITHDPYLLPWKGRDVYVDLGAEMFGAQKENAHIAVEVKSFLGRSETTDLERALGQFVLYRFLLKRYEPVRTLYLAVPDFVLESLFDESIGRLLIENEDVKVFGFDVTLEEVTKWLPQRP
jgi:XisH protein